MTQTSTKINKSRETLVFWGRAMRSLSTNVVEDPRSAPFHFRQSGTHPGGTLSVERLRMVQPENEDNSKQFAHAPVMLDEIVEAFAGVPDGVLIDATLGGGGHASALLDAYPGLRVLGLDRDESAVSAATSSLARFGERVQIRNVRFDDLQSAAALVFPGLPIVGVLFDLGVSSHQLDVAQRGFSYRSAGPLDMRMDRRQDLTAARIVNEYDEQSLTRVLRSGGEEQFAPRVARNIIAARPINDTVRLAEIVRESIPAPARRRKGDPAKRSFQALRLEVNDEMSVLESAISSAIDIVAPGGRIATLAYHSGEDRIVKRHFVSATTGDCACPTDLPCVCGAISRAKLVFRGSRKPSEAELVSNPRSASARMRVLEMIPPVSSSEAGPK